MSDPNPLRPPLGKIDLPSLGNRIAEVRTRRRWSQRHLAQLARLRPERISRLEGARVDPGLQEIATLAAVLETSLDELAYGGPNEDLARVAVQRGLTVQQVDLVLRALTLGFAALRNERGPA